LTALSIAGQIAGDIATGHRLNREEVLMTKRLQLTLAVGDYEITRALKDGRVQPDGIELTVLTEMDSNTRHHRMMKDLEFDVSEISGGSYILGKANGIPMDAIPVFPHRRFRHSFMYINTGKGIKTPKDLIGRKVGLKAYANSAVTWMRGILEHEYGVPHKEIDWYTDLDEHVDFTPPKGLRLTHIPENKSIETMLCDGEIDALLHSDIIYPITNKDPRVGRLFPDYRAEQIRYFQKTGIFPIMHAVAIKSEIVEKYPWVPQNLQIAFNKAKDIGVRRMANPRVAPMVLYLENLEEQERIFGPDPFQYGMTPSNVKNLETLAGYCHEQGLTKRLMKLDELFLPVSVGAKRDDVFRF
jgi:4,5-dihydroxyphthalate decarboxylase